MELLVKVFFAIGWVGIGVHLGVRMERRAQREKRFGGSDRKR